MLYTRNAFSFRKFYKEKVAREQGRLDLNFVGSLHPDKSRRETGFSKLIYGNREDLGKLLGTIALNVAADDQAIYELIQNADDCKSSFFSVSYNEEYLLCINNGNYFSNQDMSAIINVAGNYKEGEDIGTFGIGFKILHRLVGKDDGREAIINDYAGPIIFSWNKFYQLKSFLEGDEIRIGYDSERDNENAWLIKLLYTCFPTHLGEKIRLQDYDTQDVKFTDSELSEMRECLKSSLQNVNLTETNYLKNGSIFFLKLGEGKSKFLDDGIDKIKSGLSYSFKFLNRLEKIYINEEEIKAQRVMDYSQSFPIDSQEFNTINPKNKKRDIKFTFAYYRDYRKAENLRNEVVPNLYTFFSMDEEKNGFNFLLHCNAFDMNNDRRKLQANSQINEKLLPAIASNIIQYIDNQKVNKNLFVSLYANLLLSKEPKNKPHINNSFFQYFKKYILENIPTSNSYSDNPQNVKIKNTLLEIYPSDFGCSEIDWFYWNDEKYDSILINEARNSEKLNLKEWNIIDLLEYAIEKGKINYVDDWIRNAQPKIYFLFLKEIERHITKTALTMVAQIRLFKFSDENFYSLKDIFSSNDLILNYDKTSDIRFEMQAIGFKSSYVNIAEYPNIKELIENKLDDLVIFQQIADRVKDNQLRKDQKHKLLLALQEFNGVGIEKLKNLELFKDTKGNIRPLRNLLKGDIQVPNWLFPFKIHIAEYIPELDQYLIDEAAIYKELIYQNWDEIIANARDEKEFYAKIIYYFGLNTDNPSLKRDTHNYIYTKDGFKTFNQIFFNSKMKELGSQYVNFQNAVTAILGYPTPQKSVLHFLEQSPFYVQNGDFCEQNINTVCLEILEINEIKAAIYFCQLNGEHFFENLIVEKIEGQFFVSAKTEDVYQVKPSNKEVIDFILENLSDNFKILPPELDAYKDESGIIQKEELYELILHNVEIDDYKEELIDIIAYDEPKCKLLFGLSEIRFITAKRYSKESFEYKVLDKAIQNLNITDYDNFKEKFVFENEGSDLSLSDIPPCADKIKIDDIELSLSEILPDSYQNSNILSALIDKFVKLGLPKDKLDALFGISSEAEPEEIFELLSENYKVLQNAQQLAFVILYDINIEDVDFEKFEVETYGDQDHLSYPYYTNHHSFLSGEAVLNEKYKNVEEFLSLPIKTGKNTEIIKNPYFSDEKFNIPYINEEMEDDEKIAFLDFLYDQYTNHRKKTAIQNIDWSKIDEKDTKVLLGFNPLISVYPNKYACESEQLPDYILDWIENNEQKLQFLSDLGVWTQSSIVVELRKFLNGESETFNKARLSQTTRFNDEETNLFNSFEWLKENEIELSTPEQFETFKKIVDAINDRRESNSKLEIEKNYEFGKLEENSTEWKETENFTIYLYDGEMPVTVWLDEIEDYIFYCYNEDDYVVNEGIIYINSQEDKKKILQKVASDDENDFSFEDLWALFGDNSRDVELAEKDAEIVRLRSQLKHRPKAEEEDIPMSDNLLDNIDENTRISIQEEAQRKVFETLKTKGYNIPPSLVKISFTVVDGIVSPRGQKVRIVTKSAKGGTIYFTPFEWLALCEPESQLFIVSSNNQVNNVTIEDLETINDKFHLRFNTEIFAVHANLKIFAQLVRKLPETHFLFKAPINTTDFFNPFGLDDKNTSAVELTQDDIKLLL